MSKHRLVRIALVIAVVTTILPLVAATPAGAQASPRGDPGLLGTEVRGTGVLPNFADEGANLIRLQVGAFDPLVDPLPTPTGIPLVNEATLAPPTAQYWLVQVKDNQFPAVADAVTAAGGLIVGYVHDDTYMVRATPAQSAQIEASPAVRWAGYYQPAWRVPVAAVGRPGLLDLDGTRVYRVHVFSEDPAPGAVGEALKAMAGVEVVGDSGVVVDVRATATQVPAMAALPAVEWIGVRSKAVLLNANARWVNDTGIRDLFSATAPGRLTGAGQTAAVVDTGLNYTYDLNHRAHVAFRDCDASGVCKEAIYTQLQPGAGEAQMNDVVNNATAHRKMVAYFDLAATGPNPFDPSSHGSHTAGSVDGDQPPFGQYTADDGLAPAAKHVHQNIGSSSGGLTLPEDLYDLFRQAYRPRDPASVSETSGANGNPSDYGADYRPLEDARTHNNSWGLIAPLADLGDSVRLDQFVWDHEDMVISVSAGNAGPAPGTIGAPSVAKSDLSSGAAANGRQPMVSIDSMASFSSHGPTADGRLGPDLATPGQVVVSVKGGSTRGYHVAQGTSMSSPVLTGLATLVRQYFFDGYAAAGGDGFAAGAPAASRSHNPSAALVKAGLINGAIRMRGFYTGDDGTTRALDGQWPSAGQGFGRVNLANSLYFSGDPTNNWYIDRFRGDTSGPMNSRSFSVSATPQTRTFQLQVGAGQPLDVTLAWTDAPDLLPAGSPALINNLDLVVTAPNGTTYVGNNMNSRTNPGVGVAETLPGAGPVDTTNPTERVRIAAPAPGTYSLTVQAGPIADGNQGFALAASGNIAPSGGNFTPGPQLQVDQAGSPTISGVTVKALSANTAEVRFETNEPTTATADVTPSVGTETFVDSYNEGTDGFTGLNEGAVETSAEYADKPVVGTKHEMLLTGFSPGQTYTIALTARDLANNPATHNATLKAPATVFQADSNDTGQCFDGDPSCQWNVGTQLYAGNVDGGGLGAFMFRTQGVNPNAITMATVEMTSAHNWVVPYTEDPVLYADLLNAGVEPNWGTQDYTTIRGAPADARVFPETTHKVGGYQRYAFTFNCADLQALKDTLATNGNAAFRWDSNDGGFFSMDFGFNRRSGGPDLRPRLVLYTGATETNPTGEECNANTPAPTITDVGIHAGIQDGSVTVSWDTDVASDSLLLFREQGTEPWIQVGTPARTKVHHVQVRGLTPEKEYEFAVRSAACNGATTTDTNQGKGYDFFRPPPPVVPTDEYFFHGEATDQAEKAAFDPRAATFDLNPADATPGTQTATPFANENFVANPLAAYWTGDFTGAIDGEVELQWYWSTTNPAAIAIGADVEVTFFADPDFSPEADPVQPERIIGRGVVELQFDDTLPTLNTNRVPVRGTVQNEMTVQVVPIFADTGQDLVAHYDSVTPSKMLIPTEPAPEPAEPLPLTGPVPPPSAGATGLTPPPTRTGDASAADIAAGTGFCVIPAQKADLSISKSDSPDPVFAGQELTYTLTVSNGGPADATGVEVTDTPPAGVTFTSATASQGSCSEAGGTVTCNLGALANGAPAATVTIKVKPQSAGTITNSASVTANEEDPTPGNNTDTENTTVSAAADLSVTKTDAPDPAHVGQPLVYTVTVTNNGPSTATGVTAVDTLPKNTGSGMVSTTKGTCSIQKSRVNCSIGTMVSGESAVITITVKPTRKGTLTNTVSVSAASPADPNTANNTATATTQVLP